MRKQLSSKHVFCHGIILTKKLLLNVGISVFQLVSQSYSWVKFILQCDLTSDTTSSYLYPTFENSRYTTDVLASQNHEWNKGLHKIDNRARPLYWRNLNTVSTSKASRRNTICANKLVYVLYLCLIWRSTNA